MRETTKRFTVPTAWLNKRLPQLLLATGALNSRKIRRTRRSGWMLVSFSGKPQIDSTTIVSVILRKAPRMGVYAFYKKGLEIRRVDICPYTHIDIGKMLKDLTVASAKLASRLEAA